MKLKHDKQPKYDLEVKPLKTENMTPEQGAALIAARANAALQIMQEPDAAKREALLEVLKNGEVAEVTVVPFKRRPQTLRELLLLKSIRNAARRLFIRLK